MSRNLFQLLLGGQVDWHRVGMEAGAPWQKDPLRWGPPLEPTHYARIRLPDDVMPGELALTLQGLESERQKDPLPPEVDLAIQVLSDPLRKAGYDAYLRRERRRLVALETRRRRLRLMAIGGAALVLVLLVALAVHRS